MCENIAIFLCQIFVTFVAIELVFFVDIIPKTDII